MDLAQLLDKLANGPPTAALIIGLCIALWWYASGKGRNGAQVDAEKKDEAERRDRVEARLVAERDAAIALAQSYGDQFERALDIIEGQTKT